MLTSCPNLPDQTCPRSQCLGLQDSSVCHHLAGLTAARARPPGPGPLTMIANFAAAAAAQIAAGNPIADEAVQAQRLAICLRCPLHQPEVDGCASCGCKSRAWLPGIDLALKRSWATSACPEKHWDAVA